MKSKEEMFCIFNSTTSATTRRSVNDVLWLNVAFERTASSLRHCMQNLNAPVACAKISRNNCPAMPLIHAPFKSIKSMQRSGTEVTRTQLQPSKPKRFLVWTEALRSSQQFFSHVGTEPLLPGYYQYVLGGKCILLKDTIRRPE